MTIEGAAMSETQASEPGDSASREAGRPPKAVTR